MKFQILKIGRPAHSAYEELAGVYSKRLKPIWKIEEHFLKALPSQERSGKEIYARLGWTPQGVRQDPQHLVIVLDERGKELSSPDLAHFFQTTMNQGQIKLMSIIIGGPYGLSEDIRKAADLSWSLSKAVFPSDLAWLMVWEQMYRASTILRGTSYHHS